jgi:hypothetical protein
METEASSPTTTTTVQQPKQQQKMAIAPQHLRLALEQNQ